MSSRVQSATQTMKATPKHNQEMEEEEEESELTESRKCLSSSERKLALQDDVDKLRKKLSNEENVHRALKRAFTRPLGALPRLPPYLPSHILELLSEVAVLEEEVIRLEEQVLNFRQGLYQEAIHISSFTKTRENGLDSCCGQLSSPNAKNSKQLWSFDGDQVLTSFNNKKRPSKKPNCLLVEEHGVKVNRSNANSTMNAKQSPIKKVKRLKMLDSQIDEQAANKEKAVERIESVSNDPKELEEPTCPNKLSEEILRCLLRIFSQVSLTKKKMLASERFSSISGSSDSLEVKGFLDPYDICKEFGRRDIGPYKNLQELQASSIDSNLLTNSFCLTGRLKILLKKLSSVDMSALTHQQKLAFWINIYNACLMNAFLENGMCTTPEMVVELMTKAMVNVGGHLLSAMKIEHFILRLPYYSKHISFKGLQSGEKTTRTNFSLDWPEPLVAFALSCGSWSSPTVRVYTVSQVEQQLEEAMREYLQAAVGILKPNRLAIPKLLDWYMLDFSKDIESLMDWICLQLPIELRNDAVECLEMYRSSVFPLPIQVIPYEFKFRYLLVL